MSATIPQQEGQSSQKSPLTFEFTKRKRWADLLTTELADVIILILSVSCEILYCGTAVTELLGWREADLIDLDLCDLIHPDDKTIFRASFEEAVRGKSDLHTYARLKCGEAMSSASSSSKELLFEINGYLHPDTEEDTEYQIFFATAKPYPSRNMTMLNEFLDLKTENERLEQRAAELRSRVSQQSLSEFPILPVQSNLLHSASAVKASSSDSMMEPPDSFYTMPVQDAVDESLSIPSRSSIDGSAYTTGALFSNSATGNTEEDLGEDGSKKKKLKKTHPSEQYVCITCGRTDSPEWRKGPLGPKTLCNACGLRWAKQMRKYDDPPEDGGDNGSIALT